MERREITPFLGLKGSGKSSLIAALFPDLEVNFKEPEYYRDYMISEWHYIREVSGKEETVRLLLPATSKWRVEKAVVVFDLSRRESLSWAMGTMSLLEWRFLLVGNKSDLPEREISLSEASSLAERRGARLFIVSALTGDGVEGLKRALIGEIPPEEVRVPPTPVPAPALRRDYLPIPLEHSPSTDGLSDVELRLLELIDGKRTALELSKELGVELRVVQIYLKRLHAKGKIKDLRLVVM
jgi:DNA-binding CsgD family transcriptional regulator